MLIMVNITCQGGHTVTAIATNSVHKLESEYMNLRTKALIAVETLSKTTEKNIRYSASIILELGENEDNLTEHF